MTSNLFFKLQNSNDRFTDKYVIGLLENKIYEKRFLDFTEAFNELEKQFPTTNFNKRRLKEILDENFISSYEFYYLSEIQKKEAGKKSEVKKLLSELMLKPQPDLFDKLYKLMDQADYNFNDAVLIVLAIASQNNDLSFENCIEIILDIEENGNAYCNEIKDVLANVTYEYTTIDISTVIEKDNVLKLLNNYGIYSVENLKNLNVEKILPLIVYDVKYTIRRLSFLSGKLDNEISDILITYLTTTIGNHQFEVINLRYGLDGNKPLTLEQCGEKFGVTRERIRQIESEAIRRIHINISLISDNIEMLLKLHTVSKEYCVISTEELAEEIHSINTARMIAFLTMNFSFSFSYFEDIDCFYETKFITYDQLINSVLNKYDFYISKKLYDSASLVERNIIDTKYRQYKRTSNIYIKEGCTISDVYDRLISNIFPEGYRIYNDDDYSKFEQCFKKIFDGDTEGLPTQCALRGLISRNDFFCQINKGTYKERSQCVDIPNGLMNQIFDFIVEHLPTVEYLQIYDSFKDALLSCGVDNYFYMKGLIDHVMPEDIHTKRTYLTSSSSQQSIITARIEFIRKMDSIFSMDDLHKKYPGVKEYTFSFLFYDEVPNGLLFLSKKNFIYFDKTGISDSAIQQLKIFLNHLFETEKTDVFTSRKIYAKLKIFNSDLLNQLHYMDDQFSLFSLIQYVFAKEYYFSRPYISCTDSKELTSMGILNKHLSNESKISYEDIKRYCSSMNIPSTNGFATYLDEFADEFVQVNENTMIKKELLQITDLQLKNISDTIDLMLDKSDVIHLSKFNAYSILPKLNEIWNQYLLAGITRSYLSNIYNVFTNEQDYRIAEYEIRRVAQ